MKRMMKKKVLAIIGILSLVLICGCGEPPYIEESNDTEMQNQAVADNEQDAYTFLRESNDRLCTSDKGLYYVKVNDSEHKLTNPEVYYYDYATKSSSIWCSNINCKHADEDCSAYIDEKYQFVEYANDSVFKLRSDDTGIYLIQCDEDGSNEIKVANLIEDQSGSVVIDVGRIYEDNLYYMIKDEGNNTKVYRANLIERNKIEYLFSLDGADSKISSTGMYINDNCIYASLARLSVNDKSYSRVIYQYSFSDRNLKEVVNRTDYYRSCANDTLYYFTEDKELFKVLDDGTVKEVSPGKFKEIDSDGYGIFCNEKYIVFGKGMDAAYLLQNEKIYVYDIENDRLGYITEADMPNAASEAADKTSSLFWGVAGLSEKYCFIDACKGKGVYAIEWTSVFSENPISDYIIY